MIPIKRALVSVSDKTGVLEFCQTLRETCGPDLEILSTGGTAALLRKNDIAVTEVSDYTGFPEMMSGRLKTLHPKVHGGILARRTEAGDLSALEAHGMREIDLVVVNLYPFEATISKPDCTLEEAVENIDIGGPTMLRAAAKNWEHVAVVSSAAFYPRIMGELKEHGGKLSRGLRFLLSRSTYEETSKYDGMIANYFGKVASKDLLCAGEAGDGGRADVEDAVPARGNKLELTKFSDFFYTGLKKKQALRYGENPHQGAALYVEPNAAFASVANAKQLQGKELSYNNIADADAALDCCLAFGEEEFCCVIVKHANPCGVAVSSSSLLHAYEKAFQTDPTSAFGGIIAVNKVLDVATAEKIVQNQFVEVILAPSAALEAVSVVGKKKNVRLLEYMTAESGETEKKKPMMEYKKIRGGLLVQDRDEEPETMELRVVTKRAPTEEEIMMPDEKYFFFSLTLSSHSNSVKDLKFAWKVCQFVKSNAIVYAKDGMTYGVGAGQMSRVFSSRIACDKAKEATLELKGSAMASDAFFPFRDGIDTAAGTGVSCIIQPGGSIRDQEVIDAANEHGIAMLFTGVRHFKH
ncbi:unnamed protein product [Amoebophrya sp. A25]|nr:unnamed protein product [Amoebophrya sp. A25]|eukprot:GSA25T00023926001.1